MGKRHEQTIHKKDIKMALKLLKRWSTSPREERCKLKLHCNIIYLSDWQKFKSYNTYSVGEAVGKQARHSHKLLM